MRIVVDVRQEIVPWNLMERFRGLLLIPTPLVGDSCVDRGPCRRVPIPDGRKLSMPGVPVVWQPPSP